MCSKLTIKTLAIKILLLTLNIFYTFFLGFLVFLLGLLERRITLLVFSIKIKRHRAFLHSLLLEQQCFIRLRTSPRPSCNF